MNPPTRQTKSISIRNTQPKKKQKKLAITNEEEPKLSPLQRKLFTFSKSLHSQRFEIFKTYEFQNSRFVCEENLKAINLDELVLGKLADMGFEKFAKIREEGFWEPTLEFISSFEIVVDKETMEEEYQFKVMAFECKRSLDEFNADMGFVSLTESMQEPYLSALCEPPVDFDPVQFWSVIASDSKAYSPSTSKSSQIRSPLLRYLQRYFSFTISPKKSNNSNVPVGDLFLLWCAENNRRVNVGYWFGKHLNSMASKRQGAPLIAPFVTHLAKNKNFYTPAVHKLTSASTMEAIDLSQMVQLKICRKVGDGYVLNEDCSQAAQDARDGSKKLAHGELEEVEEGCANPGNDTGDLMKKLFAMSVGDLAVAFVTLQNQVARHEAVLFPKKKLIPPKMEVQVAEINDDEDIVPLKAIKACASSPVHRKRKSTFEIDHNESSSDSKDDDVSSPFE